MGIVTQGVKYLGSKKNLLPFIVQTVERLGAETSIDVFSGTTRVAQALRQSNIATTTSDLSWATSCYAGAYVHNGDNAHLAPFIDEMNRLPGCDGWLTENYTGDAPVTARRGDGRCFQAKNTRRADAARDYVAGLDILPWEKATLITSIIRALDAVDNTVGVQQAYLKEWCARSHNDIQFQLPLVIDGPTAVHHEGDCLTIDYEPADVAYLDPPYSPHAYSTYYHIWDSIARWDKPPTGLKARRREDRIAKSDTFDAAMTSPWNSRKTALTAFSALIDRLPVRHCVISYSDESLISRGLLLESLEGHGEVIVEEIDYRRNIMSQIGNATVNGEPEKSQTNKELLITVKKR